MAVGTSDGRYYEDDNHLNSLGSYTLLENLSIVG